MNNGEKIKELQNGSGGQRLLAAQREAYTEAKRCNLLKAVVCLILPVIISVVELFVCLPDIVVVFIALLSLVCGTNLSDKSADLVDKAASIQQTFDSLVYGLDFENQCLDADEICELAKRYTKHPVSRRNKQPLKGWYEVASEKLSSSRTILKCQEQNMFWTKRMLHRSVIFDLILASMGSSVVFVCAFFARQDPLLTLFLSPVAEWICVRMFGAHKVNTALNSLLRAQAKFNLATKENVVIMQREIYELRKSPYLTSDLMYRMFRERDQRATSR